MALRTKIYTAANFKVENELSVLLGSIHRLNVPFELAVIDSGLTLEFKSKVQEWISQTQIQVEYIFQDQSFYQGCYRARGLGCWLKLAGPRLLKEKADRLIYLDVDYLLQSDLSELRDIELQEHCFAACQTYAPETYQTEYWIDVDDESRQAKLGGETRFKPFNSGLMVIDVQKWLQENVENRVTEISRKCSHFFHGDQCILNALYGHRYLTLNALYNVHPDVVYREKLGIGKIKGFHLMGFRPWKKPQQREHICWYAFPHRFKTWRLLLKSVAAGPNGEIGLGIISHQLLSLKIVFQNLLKKGK